MSSEQIIAGLETEVERLRKENERLIDAGVHTTARLMTALRIWSTPEEDRALFLAYAKIDDPTANQEVATHA